MLRTDAPLGRCGCAGRPWSAWFKGITSCCAARATAETPTTSHHCLLLHTGTKVPRLPFLTTFTFSLSIIAKPCQGLLSPKLTNTASKQAFEGVVMVRSSADQAAMAWHGPPSPSAKPTSRPSSSQCVRSTNFSTFSRCKISHWLWKNDNPLQFSAFFMFSMAPLHCCSSILPSNKDSDLLPASALQGISSSVSFHQNIRVS